MNRILIAILILVAATYAVRDHASAPKRHAPVLTGKTMTATGPMACPGELGCWIANDSLIAQLNGTTATMSAAPEYVCAFPKEIAQRLGFAICALKDQPRGK